MGFFSNLKDKIPILANLGGTKKTNKSTVELQYDKAMNLLDNANGVGAVEVLEGMSILVSTTRCTDSLVLMP